MKLNPFMTILALLASLLIGYAFYAAGCKPLHMWVSSLEAGLFLVVGMGLSLSDYPRSTILLKVCAFVFLIVGVVLNIILISTDVAEAGFVITNGIVVIVALALGYLIQQSKQ